MGRGGATGTPGLEKTLFYVIRGPRLQYALFENRRDSRSCPSSSLQGKQKGQKKNVGRLFRGGIKRWKGSVSPVQASVPGPDAGSESCGRQEEVKVWCVGVNDSGSERDRLKARDGREADKKALWGYVAERAA